MGAKESDGWIAGTESLPAAEETSLARKYWEMGINGGEMEEEGETSLAREYREMNINGGEMEEGEMEEEEEGDTVIKGDQMEEEEVISDFVARFASQRRREERLALIADDLQRMKELRGSRAPTFIELAAYVLLREIAAASLEGLPTTLSARSLFD